MMMTHCQDHILTKKIYGLYGLNGDKWRCHRCGTTKHPNKVRQSYSAMDAGWLSFAIQFNRICLFLDLQRDQNLLKCRTWNWDSQGFPFIYICTRNCETQRFTDQKLSSSIFSCRPVPHALHLHLGKLYSKKNDEKRGHCPLWATPPP